MKKKGKKKKNKTKEKKVFINIVSEWWLVCHFMLYNEAAEFPDFSLSIGIQDADHEGLVYPFTEWYFCSQHLSL